MGKLKVPKVDQKGSPNVKVTKVKPTISKVKHGVSKPQPPEQLKKIGKSIANGKMKEGSNLVTMKGKGKPNISKPGVQRGFSVNTPPKAPPKKNEKKSKNLPGGPDKKLFSHRPNITVGGKSPKTNKADRPNLGNVNKTKRIVPNVDKTGLAPKVEKSGKKTGLAPKVEKAGKKPGVITGKRNISEVEKDVPEKTQAKQFKKSKIDKKKSSIPAVKNKVEVTSSSAVIQADSHLKIETLNAPINGLFKLTKKDSKNSNVSIYIQLNFFNAFKPAKRVARFPVVHSLIKQDAKMCLFVRDSFPEPEKTILHFKDKLKAGGLTQNMKIIPFSVLAKDYSKFEAKKTLVDSYDLFIIDSVIAHRSSNKLGKIFYKSRKFPLPITLENNKDLKGQLQKCMKKTTANFSQSATQLIFAVANTSMNVEQVKDNIKSVWGQINNLIPGGLTNVKSASIRTSTSKVIPFYMSVNTSEAKISAGTSEMIWQRSKSDDKNASVQVYPTGNLIVKKEGQLTKNQKKREKKRERKLQKKAETTNAVKNEGESNEEDTELTSKDMKRSQKGKKQMVKKDISKQEAKKEGDSDSDDENDQFMSSEFDDFDDDMSDLELDDSDLSEDSDGNESDDESD